MVETTSLIALGLKSASSPAAKMAWKSWGQQKFNDLRAKYVRAFDPFLESSLARCAKLKTIVDRNAYVDLTSIYTSMSLVERQSSITDVQLLSRAKDMRGNWLIRGRAGAGKSILLRWMTIALADTLLEHQRIPLYCEVRDMDLERSGEGLDEYVFRHVKHKRSKMDIDLFRAGLEAGLFVVMLDGLDECPTTVRSKLLRYIDDFSRHFSASPLFVSSRPDPYAESLATLGVADISPLELSQALKIIKTSSFNEEKKEEFATFLTEGGFKKHNDLLEIPLMVLVMMLSYDSTNVIPEKMSLFYKQAFNALFYQHDASKGRRFRERKSGLEIDEFGKIFSYFSASLYFQERVSFDKELAISNVRDAVAASDVSVTPSDFLDDALSAVCLLIDDGNQVTYSHRTFQEYFTAKFLAGYEGEDFIELVKFISKKGYSDLVLQILQDIAEDKLLKGWAIPTANKMLAGLDSAIDKNTEQSLRDGAISICSHVTISDEGVVVGASMLDHGMFQDAFLINGMAKPAVRPPVIETKLVDKDAEYSPKVKDFLFKNGKMVSGFTWSEAPLEFFKEVNVADFLRTFRNFIEVSQKEMAVTISRAPTFASSLLKHTTR